MCTSAAVSSVLPVAPPARTAPYNTSLHSARRFAAEDMVIATRSAGKRTDLCPPRPRYTGPTRTCKITFSLGTTGQPGKGLPVGKRDDAARPECRRTACAEREAQRTWCCAAAVLLTFHCVYAALLAGARVCLPETAGVRQQHTAYAQADPRPCQQQPAATA